MPIDSQSPRTAAISGLTGTPCLTIRQVAKQSNAARSMCLWVRAMQNYATVIKVVAPKRRALVEAEENLAEMQKQLQHKRKHLARINDEVEAAATPSAHAQRPLL